MSDLVIETTKLRKEFRTRRGRHVVAVDGLDLAVPRGGVHGFLGPNGSGKTTTIRMLLGLARATAGDMRLFGEPVPRPAAPGDRPDRRGRRAAEVHPDVQRPAQPHAARRQHRRPPHDRRLGDRAGRSDRARPGEVQGLLARHEAAPGDRGDLLKSPDLLILDEPTNGLDPAGIRDIRDMIRGLGESGVTVLLSSHILAEVQQVCDSVSIIGNGRLLAHGRVDDLVGSDGRHGYRVGVADPGAAGEHLVRAGYVVRREGDVLLVEGAADPADITRALAQHELYVRELAPDRPDLESVFLSLTRGDTLGGAE